MDLVNTTANQAATSYQAPLPVRKIDSRYNEGKKFAGLRDILRPCIILPFKYKNCPFSLYAICNEGKIYISQAMLFKFICLPLKPNTSSISTEEEDAEDDQLKFVHDYPYLYRPFNDWMDFCWRYLLPVVPRIVIPTSELTTILSGNSDMLRYEYEATFHPNHTSSSYLTATLIEASRCETDEGNVRLIEYRDAVNVLKRYQHVERPICTDFTFCPDRIYYMLNSILPTLYDAFHERLRYFESYGARNRYSDGVKGMLGQSEMHEYENLKKTYRHDVTLLVNENQLLREQNEFARHTIRVLMQLLGVEEDEAQLQQQQQRESPQSPPPEYSEVVEDDLRFGIHNNDDV